MKVGEGVEAYAYETLDASYISEFKGFGAHDSSRSKGQCHEVKGQVQDQDHSFRGIRLFRKKTGISNFNFNVLELFGMKKGRQSHLNWFRVPMICRSRNFNYLHFTLKKCVMFRNYYHNAEKKFRFKLK